jgi:cardiolipin synthase
MIPMMLTVSRFFAAPFIMRAVATQQWWVATALFLGAACTDALDGFLARLWNQQTKIGSYLDPLADKFLMLCCYFSLVEARIIPTWFFMGICVKEVLLLCAASCYAYVQAVPMSPLWTGKSAMVAQVLFVAGLFWAQCLYSSLIVSHWIVLSVFVLAILPLGHYALRLSWRYV